MGQPNNHSKQAQLCAKNTHTALVFVIQTLNSSQKELWYPALLPCTPLGEKVISPLQANKLSRLPQQLHDGEDLVHCSTTWAKTPLVHF